jgi:hypothetical protein
VDELASCRKRRRRTRRECEPMSMICCGRQRADRCHRTDVAEQRTSDCELWGVSSVSVSASCGHVAASGAPPCLSLRAEARRPVPWLSSSPSSSLSLSFSFPLSIIWVSPSQQMRAQVGRSYPRRRNQEASKDDEAGAPAPARPVDSAPVDSSTCKAPFPPNASSLSHVSHFLSFHGLGHT